MSQGITMEIMDLLLIVLITVIIALIFRPFLLWYWKINTTIKNQEKLIEQNDEILKKVKN